MYSKTSLGSDQLSGGPRLSRRGKRTMFGLLGLIGLVALGLGIWSAVGGDPYTTSAKGCVSLTIPSSTGGATLHYCGAEARSFCKSAFGSADRISLLARPQCVLAGLTEAKVSAG